MMKKLITPLLAILTFTAGYAQEGSKNFIDQNYLEVTGFAEREVSPDRIYLEIVINEKDIKSKTLEEMEKSMIDKLQEIGIDVSKDLAIKDFISNFKHYWILKSDILLIKQYQLLVYDAKTVGKVFVELEKLGISTITIERLESSEIEKIRQEVKLEAIKSARANADALASAIDQEAGRALFIVEHGNNTNMEGLLQGRASGFMVRGLASKGVYGSRAPEPDIDFEKIKLEYTLTVRFELK